MLCIEEYIELSIPAKNSMPINPIMNGELLIKTRSNRKKAVEYTKIILGLLTVKLEIKIPPTTAPAPSTDAKDAARDSVVLKFSRKISAMRAKYGKTNIL